MEIDFITSNKHKVEQANNDLNKYSIHANQMKFDFREIQTVDVEEVATDKALQVIDKVHNEFIIEDTGFYIEALKGFPGALFKYIFEFLEYQKFLKLMEGENNREVYFKGVIVYGNPKTKEIKSFVGIVRGSLSHEPRGNNTRGTITNNLFIPMGWDKTLAEMNDDEWKIFLNQISNENHYEKFGLWISEKVR